MPPQDQQSVPAPQSADPAQLAPRSSVRTMRSDMEGLMQSSGGAKPSLMQSIRRRGTPQIPQQPGTASGGLRILLRVVALLIVAAIMLLGALAALPQVFPNSFLSLRNKIPGLSVYAPTPASPAHPAATAPNFFSTETTQDIVASLDSRAIFFELMDHAIKGGERQGTMKRLLITTTAADSSDRFMTMQDVFDFYRISAPPPVLQQADGVAFFFAYFARDGGRFGAATRVFDSEVTLAAMGAWESRIADDLTPLLFGEPATATSTTFRQMTFRNIDWRFLPLSQTRDIGIAYGIFPARNYLILTTSSEAMEATINRLFDRP